MYSNSTDPPCIPLIDTIWYPLFVFWTTFLMLGAVIIKVLPRSCSRFRYELNFAKAHAGLIRAKMAWLPELQTPEETALVIGQVGSDKALIHQEEGRLLDSMIFSIPYSKYPNDTRKCCTKLIHMKTGMVIQQI